MRTEHVWLEYGDQRLFLRDLEERLDAGWTVLKLVQCHDGGWAALMRRRVWPWTGWRWPAKRREAEA